MVLIPALLCSTITLFTASTRFKASVLPRGNCPFCCRINLRRDVSFLLYTRANRERPQRLYLGDERGLAMSQLNRSHSTVVYIHGFTELARSKSATTIRRAYHTRGEFNVIVVDWSSIAAFPWYDRAAANTRQVGRYLARFVEHLVSRGVSLATTHVIGFSLGAEVAGFTGKQMRTAKLPRITGLDPAFPLYMRSGKRGHLTSTDAQFVDVIHTDGGVFGFPQPIGHADFFPNGGQPTQPGCRIDELFRHGALESVIACSHNRAWEYYAESVYNDRAFPAVACPSYRKFREGLCRSNRAQPVFMGYNCNHGLRGKFFLNTNQTPPYGRKFH